MIRKKEENSFLSTKNKILLFILILSLTVLIIIPSNPTTFVIKVEDQYLEWTHTHWMTDIEFAYGHSIKVGATERVRMWIFDDNYYVGVLNKTNTFATLVSSNVLSEPVIIHPGEEEYFEVTRDDRYDIYVKFNHFDYVNNKINLTIKSTNLPVINETIQEEPSPPKPKPTPITENPALNWNKILLIVGSAIVGLVLIELIILYTLKRLKPKKPE